MKVSKILKKQIFIELLVLLLFCIAIVYAIYALKKQDSENVSNYDGVVAVLDDSKFKALTKSSDGEGLNSDGVIYTITNNREETINYNIIIIPSTKDKNIIKNIKVSLDDGKIYKISELNKTSSGYKIGNIKLERGYTKIHSIKLWYDLNSKGESPNIKFDYKIQTN